MRIQVDLRSALLGLGAGIGLTLCLGATTLTTPAVGRYKVATMTDRALVIDTVTGKVWRAYFPTGQGGNTDPEFLKAKNE